MGQNGTKFRENYKNNEKRGWELCNNYLIVRNLDESGKEKEQLSHQNIKMKSSKIKNPTSFMEKTKKKYLKKKPKSKLILFEVNREDISKYFYISKKEANISATSHKNQKRKSSLKRKLKQENQFCCDIKSIKSGSSSISRQWPSEISSKISTIRKYLMENSSCSEYSMSMTTSAPETTTLTNTPFLATDQTSLSWPSIKKYCDFALANLFDQSKSKLMDDQFVEPKLNLRHNNTVQIIMNVKKFSSSHTLFKMQSKDAETSNQHLKLLQQLSKESENTLNRLIELGKKYNLKSECPKSSRLNSNRSCQTLEVAICLDPLVKLPEHVQMDVIPRVVDIKSIIEEVPQKHESVVNTLCATSFEESSSTTDFSKILCDTETKSEKEESSTNACSSKTTITDEHIWSSLKVETLGGKPKNEKRTRKTKIANSDKSLKRMRHDSALQFESEIVISKVTERKKVKRMSLPRKRSQNVVEIHTKKDYFALEATSSCCDKTSEDISEVKKSKHVNFKENSVNMLEVKKKKSSSRSEHNSTTYLIVNKFEEVLNKMLLLITNKRETQVVEKSTSAINTFPSKQVISRPFKNSLNNLRIQPRECRFVNQWDSIATNYSNASLDENESSTYSISGWNNESRHGIDIPYKGWDSPSRNQTKSEISESSQKNESSRSMQLPNPILAKECLSEFMRTLDNDNLNVKKKNSNQCFSCSFQTVAFVAILYLTLLQFILTFTVNYFSSFGK